MAFVSVLGVLVLQGCKTSNSRNLAVLNQTNKKICQFAVIKNDNNILVWDNKRFPNYVREAKFRKLSCDVYNKKINISTSNKKKSNNLKSKIIKSDEINNIFFNNLKSKSDLVICSVVSKNTKTQGGRLYLKESERRGLNCNIQNIKRSVIASKQNQEEIRKIFNIDTRVPLLKIISNNTKGKRGTITGIARDNIEVAEVSVDGKPVSLSNNGTFKYSTFVPSDGITLNVQVTDIAGLTSSKTVSLQRNNSTVSTSISFDRLNPLGKRVKANSNALALIVGVEAYKNTNADAIFADKDAKMFRDYASEKLGIPENRIKTLLNDKAEYAEIILITKE